MALTLGAPRRASNRVDVCPAFLYAAVGLRAAAYEAEAAEVEIEEIGRGVDASQGAVQLEVIALILLHEAARKHNLKHVAAKTMAYAPAYVPAVFVVGKSGCHDAAA